MRSTTRPTTARCTLPQYMGFFISEPKSATYTRLAEVTGFSHDSANRFLHWESYQPKDMYDQSIVELIPTGGTLSVDDSVLDKPYSYSVDLVGYFWSGKHHRAVKGSTWSLSTIPTHLVGTCPSISESATSRQAKLKMTTFVKCCLKCCPGE